MTNNRSHRPSLDTRDGLLRELATIDVEGWEGAAGRRLLAYVLSHIVRPQVLSAGLSGLAVDQAEASGWAAAWEAMSRPGIRTAGSPWGLLWVAVRRAIMGEMVAAAHLTGDRNGWRVERARQLAGDDRRGRANDPPVSLSLLLEYGWEPAADDVAEVVELGPRLEAVAAALVDAGWEQPAARAVVEGVAVTAVRDGKASTEAVGWRPLAAHLGLPPWQVRRVTVLLLGAPGWPGLVERMVFEGLDVLDEQSTQAALQSTASRRWPPPPKAARCWAPQAGEREALAAS